MKKDNRWYDSSFFNWIFSSKKKTVKKEHALTEKQKQELVKINGGWYEDELFIPMMTKREAMLRYSSTWKAIWFFCLPTIVLMVVQGLYNILDKSLALVFVTPHAAENVDYIKYMILGNGDGKFTNSIILNVLNSNNGDDYLKIASNYFNGSESQLHYIADLLSKIKTDNSELKELFNYVSTEHINLAQDKIKEYLNVATQYTVQSYNIALSFTQILAIGAGMHYATEFGKRNKEKLKEIAGNGIVYSFLASIIIAFVLFSLSFRPWGQVLITSQMGGNRNLIVEEMAWKDVEPLIYGMSAIFLAYVTMNMLRSEGKMVHIMIMTISSLAVKFMVSILAMKYSNLELTGAQLGTILAFAYQFGYCLVVMFFSKVTYSNFRWENLYKLNIDNLIYSIKAGFPNFINYFSFVVNGYVSTALVVRLPESSAGPSIAANGGVSILQQLISAITPWNEFILSACVGLNQGVRTMIAYNYGAGKNDRIKEILKRSSWLMFGWFVFILLLIISAGPSMLTLFAFPNEYAKYGNVFYLYLFLFFMFYPLACFTYIDLGLFQGTSRTKAATISSSLRALVVFVPLTVIGWAVSNATNDPVWYFVFIGLTDLISGFILVPLLIGFYKRTKEKNGFINKNDDNITIASYLKLRQESASTKEEKDKFEKEYITVLDNIYKEHGNKKTS